ncbi:U1 snRNP 70K protein [Favolaschia claudopus]|uniref:U1 snRNP 70K protein n=1 Tax=Favolaschia claudopus TaxID=2862362 RepID=A0AAW0C567_9AGAR
MAHPRAKLYIDPSAKPCVSTPSPSSASTTLSALSPLTTRPSSASSHTTEEEDDKALKSDADKPKRSRVTPEQLVHLERFFALERSPTATRRREIGELLGMHERQTQIWFQNRRAKAKHQNSKLKKSKDASLESMALPRLSTAFENELNNLIHEDEPVTFIPCSDLSIGSWRRIATDANQRDLVAYTCEGKRCLTWFIHNGGFGFKMEIPFDSIVDTEFTHASPGSTGLATFVLSRTPTFFLETSSENGSRHWKRCTDWTEGHQASHVSRHDLIGSAVPLVHLLKGLRANAELSSPYSPHYHSEPTSPMEIPPPPLSVVQHPHYPQDTSLIRPSIYRRRSYAAANNLSQLVVSGLSQYKRELPHTAPAVSYTHTSYLPAPTYTPAAEPVAAPEEYSSLEDYGARPISHDMTPRHFAAQSVPRQFYEKPAPPFFNPHPDDEYQSSLQSGVAQVYYQADPQMGLC